MAARPGHHAAGVAQGLERPGLGELVEPELGLELLEQGLGARAADRVAHPQAGEAPGLGEGPEDEQARELLHQRQRGVALLGVDEVAQRLVEEHDDALGQGLEQRAQLVDGYELAGGVVGVAQGDEPRALVDRAQHGLRPEAGHRHGAAAGTVGDGRVQAVRRPWRDELVEGLEQRLRRRAQQLRGAVAHDQALLRHPEVVRQLGAQRRGVAVQVAVQAATRGVGDGVDHGRGRVLGPRRRAEVERLDAGEGLLLALVGLGAQVAR